MQGGRLGHLVYDAALDNSLWPELILELTEQMMAVRGGATLPGMDDSGPFGADATELAEIADHFRRALTISERMVALQEQSSMAAGLLDALSVGIALLDERGAPMLANRAHRASALAPALAVDAGELLLAPVGQDGGGGEGDEGRGEGGGRASRPLHASRPLQASRPLRAWVREGQAGSTIRRLAPPDKGAETVLLIPSEEAVRMGFPPNAAAVMLSGGAWENDALRHFAAQHALTPRETSFVRALARVGDIRAAGEALGITYQTARTYAKRVLEKTGSASQVELLSRLARSPLAAIRPKAHSEEEAFDVRRTLVLGDGRLMEYFQLGPEDGEPVLMFDALAGVTADMLGYPALCTEHLARHGVRLITPCRPGSFRTEMRAMTSLTDFVPDLEQMLEHVGVGRFSILSVSFGAGSALATAAAMGARVERVVISAATYPAYRPPDWRDLDQFHQLSWVLARNWPAMFRQLLPFLLRSIIQNPDGYFDRYCRKARSPNDAAILGHPTIRRRIKEMILQRTALGMGGMAEENLLNARGWDFDLGAITAEVEMYHGELDNVSPVAAAEALAAALPEATLSVLPDDGHYLHILDWPWMLARAAGRPVEPRGDVYAIPQA